MLYNALEQQNAKLEEAERLMAAVSMSHDLIPRYQAKLSRARCASMAG